VKTKPVTDETFPVVGKRLVRHRFWHRFLLLLLVAAAAFAATARLYLKDGTYQIVREYKVEGDRVRYYSSERGEW